MRRLDNAGWGFESHCFVCADDNAHGLQIEYHLDEEAGEVVAEFALDHRFSGAPSWVHGGVLTAIMDDGMVWAVISTASLFAATKAMTTRFSRPVRLGDRHTVKAHVVDHDDELVCEASIVDGAGRPCAEARATFVPLGPATARDALGADPTDAETSYLRS